MVPGAPSEEPDYGDPHVLWFLLRFLLLAWLTARTGYIDLSLARRLSRLGRDHTRIDLLDNTGLRPFARNGLRNVLALMGASMLMSLFFVADRTTLIAAVGIAGMWTSAVAVLLMPLLGVRQRTIATRERELAEVRRIIRRERERSAGRLEAGEPGESSLSHWIAYEARITSVSSWPLDLSVLLRFALYTSIGLGSWLGAALVERLVDQLF